MVWSDYGSSLPVAHLLARGGPREQGRCRFSSARTSKAPHIQVHVPNIISDNAFSGLVKVHLEKSLKLGGSLKVHLEKSLKLLPLREGP